MRSDGDDDVADRETVHDFQESRMPISGHDGDAPRVAAVRHVNVAATAFYDERFCGNQDGMFSLIEHETYVQEHTGPQAAIGIGDGRLDADTARDRIESAVDMANLAVEAVLGERGRGYTDLLAAPNAGQRSEERRVGKEGRCRRGP